MKQKKHNQKKPLNITNAFKKVKPYKTQRTKQQTITPNTIYTTLINHTNKHTNPNIVTLPSRITQKHQNKNTQKYQSQRTSKNHLKRARPTGLAQNKVTKIRK